MRGGAEGDLLRLLHCLNTIWSIFLHVVAGLAAGAMHLATSMIFVS